MPSRKSANPSNKKPARRHLISTIATTNEVATFGEVQKVNRKGRPTQLQNLFKVVADKLSFELLAAIKKEHLQNFEERNGVYIAHDSVGCPRYIGRGNVFDRLAARKKAHPDELIYFSYFIVEEKRHEREIETLLLRAAAFSVIFNDRKKRVGVAPGDILDFEAGTHYFIRK